MKRFLISMAVCSSLVMFTSSAFASTTVAVHHSIAITQTADPNSDPGWLFPDWPDEVE